MNQVKRVILASLMIATLVTTALGQANTGRLDGTVQDPQGAYLAGVKVEALNVGTNAKWTTETDTQGVFIFPVLPVGLYTVTVEAQGFKKFVRENVRVDVAVYATVNAKMEVGGMVEEVTVTSTGEEVINKSSQELTTVVDRRVILDMPLVARNPITIATTVAGVSTSGGERASRINGLRQSVINITQDGINVQDNWLRSGDGFFIISSPTVENVDQFSITTSTSDASATGSGAAFIRMVTPSGTNEFHGSLFEFHRNTVLNANTFFGNLTGTPREKLIRNQFGGRVSFPIMKNKLFFWSSFDMTTSASEVARNRTVLTADARRGIFRYRDNSGNIQTVDLFKAGGITADPLTTKILNDRYPLPNNTQAGDGLGLATAGFRWNVPTYNRTVRPSFRVDWRLNDQHSVEGIVNIVRFDTDNDTLNGFEPQFPGMKGGFQDSWRRTGSFAVRSMFGANKVNEARFGFQNAPVIFGSEVDRFDINGKPTFISFPTITSPQLISVTSGRNTTNFQWLDNFSWIRGKHTHRFGGDFRSIVGNQTTQTTATVLRTNVGFNTANPSVLPSSAFPNSSTTTRTLAQNIYSILIGQIASVQRTFNVKDPQSGFVEGEFFHNRIRQRYLGFYYTDSWRVKPTLTLNYGLRYEYMTVPDQLNKLALQPVGGEAAFFGISGPGNLFRPGATGGSPVQLDLAGSSNGRKFFNEDYNNFAPTFGFAWAPEKGNWFTRAILGGPGKGSIRGGYSISYSLESASVIANALGSNQGFTKAFNLNTAAQGIQSGEKFTSFRNGFPVPAVPQFTVPIAQLDNFRASNTNGIFGFAQNLRTPYVQTWSFGIAREITRNMALEINYVGNRSVKLWRGIDINEVNIFENGFLQEFINAQKNLSISRAQGKGTRFDNQGLTGQVPLPIFAALFGATAGANYSNSTFITLLDQNEAGEFASQLFLNFLNALTGPKGGLPINFFVVNPEGQFADVITNASSSTYHALQMEVRKRFSSGLQFNVNYTFSKALTDFGGSGSNFAAFITMRNPRYEYGRASFDTNHRVNAVFVYELPFGPGKPVLNTSSSWLGKVVGGWQISGLFNAYTGQPLTFTSGRGTVNRGGRSGGNTVDLIGMTTDDLRKLATVRREGSGVYFFDPSLRGSDGRAVTSIFANPQAGKLGALGQGVLSVPGFWKLDFGLLKRVNITENKRVEFRFESFNLFNHVNFGGPTTGINSTNFGRITGTASDARIIQLAARFDW